MNNTYVGNLVDAIFLALQRDTAVGETFNIRDERLVTREEFMTIADYLGCPRPGHVPEWFARAVCPWVETWARLRGRAEPPLVTRAAIKFMVLHFDFSIEKARRVLGYEPQTDFQDGMREALDWATGKCRQRPPASAP